MEEEQVLNQKQQQKTTFTYPKLDYTIIDPEERNKLVHEIVNTVPQEKLTPFYLQQLTKYLVQDEKSKKQKTILTDNRMITINKRETSFEQLVSKLQNGEDGIYNFISEGDKNILLTPKIGITEKDIETVPGLKELREGIAQIEALQKVAKGKKKYLLTKQLIEMRQDQYVLKGAYNGTTANVMKLTANLRQIDLTQHITIDKNGDPQSDGLVSFFNPDHISCILCHYSQLKQDLWGKFESDMYYLMQAFDQLSDAALADNPVLYDIMVYKIDGLSNKEIAANLKRDHGITYSIEYLSVLWRKKIPKIIAEKAKVDWIMYHYTMEQKGTWKRCSRCHEVKLAHPYFFSKNKTSKDGYYSLCKCCRNKKS